MSANEATATVNCRFPHCDQVAWLTTGYCEQHARHVSVHGEPAAPPGGVARPERDRPEGEVTECPYGCGWSWSGFDGLYERRLHEERAHAGEVRPPEPQTVRCSFPDCDEQADVEGFCFYHARHAAPEAPPLEQPGTAAVPSGTETESEPEPETRKEPTMATTEAWTKENAIEHLLDFHAKHGRLPRQTELRVPLPGSSVLKRLFGTERAARDEAEARIASDSSTSVEEAKPEAEAVKPPPADGQSKGQPKGPIAPEPASAQASQGTSNGTLTSLAKAVEDWSAALTQLEADVAAARVGLREAVLALGSALEEIDPFGVDSL